MAESLDFAIRLSLMYLTGLKNAIDPPRSPLKRGTFLVPPEIPPFKGGRRGDRGIGTVPHQTPECCISLCIHILNPFASLDRPRRQFFSDSLNSALSSPNSDSFIFTST
jgi:hypothetical protein